MSAVNRTKPKAYRGWLRRNPNSGDQSGRPARKMRASRPPQVALATTALLMRMGASPFEPGR
jgi:hypothetical protein